MYETARARGDELRARMVDYWPGSAGIRQELQRWLERLGSGSFADVYAVALKRDERERYAVKLTKRSFQSRRERDEVALEDPLPAFVPC